MLVVDEQPRYHLMGCRALAAQQTIPLPAREAVELGFTPCGWCNPVAALGARHPASARLTSTRWNTGWRRGATLDAQAPIRPSPGSLRKKRASSPE